MLDQIKLNDSDYNEIFQKAINSIPVLSNEWTDYNYSDPGITTLQVLSIIKLFQQSYVDKVNDKIKYRLLKLLGYGIEDIKPSVANLKVESNRNFELYSSLKMMAGDIVFETSKSQNVTKAKLHKVIVYNNLENRYFDATQLIVGQTETVTYIFGKDAGVDSKIYFVFDDEIELNKDYSIYVEVDNVQDRQRNYIPEDTDFEVSKLGWQILTEKGWHDLDVIDLTHGFLQSGSISFRLDRKLVFTSIKDVGEGYMIRAVLKKSEYDFWPCLKNIYFNVFDVIQQDTQVKSFVFDSTGEDKQEYIVKDFMSIYNNIVVLVKERPDEEDGGYIQCMHSDGNESGFFCELSNSFNGDLKVSFLKDQYNFVPSRGEKMIKIICYSDHFLAQNIKTKIYGFENQVIELNKLDGIISDNFKVMIKVKQCDNKEYFYDVDKFKKNSFIEYEIDNQKRELVISKVNTSGQIDLVVTDCALSKGKNGNIRKNELNKIDKGQLDIIHKNNHEGQSDNSHNVLDTDFNFVNFCQSDGGKDSETIDELVMKVMHDLSSTHSLVTKKDFETKIFQIPGLNIHKVKAVSNSKNNSISIFIKPNSMEKFPVLSDGYKEWLLRYLDEYRLITTQIDVFSPIYVPINVSGYIYIKPNFKDADKIIKNLVERELDGINSDKDFGNEIIYGDLYSKIENLSCVEEIYSLSLKVSSRHAVELMNSNIVLDKNALSYMGDYDIEISNNIMMVV